MALSNPFSDDSYNIAVFRTYHNYAERLFIPANRRYYNYYRHATTPDDIHCLLLQRPPLTGNSFVSARRRMALGSDFPSSALHSMYRLPHCLDASRRPRMQ
jgi:hypothetical protein